MRACVYMYRFTHTLCTSRQTLSIANNPIRSDSGGSRIKHVCAPCRPRGAPLVSGYIVRPTSVRVYSLCWAHKAARICMYTLQSPYVSGRMCLCAFDRAPHDPCDARDMARGVCVCACVCVCIRRFFASDVVVVTVAVVVVVVTNVAPRDDVVRTAHATHLSRARSFARSPSLSGTLAPRVDGCEHCVCVIVSHRALRSECVSVRA